MILKTLVMQNFRSYESATMEFSEDQNYFFGRNWQGKSSVMDAVGFALFGRNVFPRSMAGSTVNLDNLVREGAQSGFVELTFQHNDHDYHLVRQCPSGKVEFEKDGEKLGQTITTVKEALYENFGLDSDLFETVFNSEQDQLRKGLDSSPESRKVFVEMLLGFEYLKDIKMSAKHASDSLADFIDEITSGNIKTVIDMIADLKRQVDDKAKIVSGLEESIKRESKSAKPMSVVSKKMSEGQRQTEKFQDQLSKLEEEKDNDSETASSIRTGKCPTCKQSIPKDLQLRLIHDLNDKIKGLQERLKAVETDHLKAESEWSKASREYENTLTLDDRLSGYTDSKNQNERELAELKASLDKYEKQYKAFANKTKVVDLINKERRFLDEFQLAIEGFRESLRKNITRDLENAVNHFMAQFSDEDFDATLKINDDFGFEVILHNRPSPIFNLSGSARDILALALRYGLYRVSATDVHFILFDEPTRHMDSVNTMKLKQAFNEMKNQQVIVITVHAEFFDAEGKKFMIEKDANLLSTIQQMN